MKKILLTLAISALAFTGSYAQTKAPKEAETPDQKAEKSTSKLQKSLSLTADQKTKIYAIELEKFKKSEAWHKESKAEKKANKAQHEVLKKQTQAKLNQVLTPVQQKKLEAIKAEKKNKKKGHNESVADSGDTEEA